MGPSSFPDSEAEAGSQLFVRTVSQEYDISALPLQAPSNVTNEMLNRADQGRKLCTSASQSVSCSRLMTLIVPNFEGETDEFEMAFRMWEENMGSKTSIPRDHLLLTQPCK